MLIDCHVHLNTSHESTRRPTLENIDELLRKMTQHGVDHAVVVTSYRVDLDHPSVEELIEKVARHPRLTLVEGLRWRGDDRTDLFHMEERIRDGWVKGIKLYPGYDKYAINDPSLESVFRIAQKCDVPVMIHTGDIQAKDAKVRQAHPLLVDDIAVDFPEVKFVICHLGSPWFQDTAEVLYKNDNVYADFSGLTLGEFDYAFERYMVQRVKDMVLYMGDPGQQLMFGTGWPLVRMGPYVKFMDNLELPEGARDNVRYGTAAKLFRIDLEAVKQAVPQGGAPR